MISLPTKDKTNVCPANINNFVVSKAISWIYLNRNVQLHWIHFHVMRPEQCDGSSSWFHIAAAERVYKSYRSLLLLQIRLGCVREKNHHQNNDKSTAITKRWWQQLKNITSQPCKCPVAVRLFPLGSVRMQTNKDKVHVEKKKFSFIFTARQKPEGHESRRWGSDRSGIRNQSGFSSSCWMLLNQWRFRQCSWLWAGLQKNPATAFPLDNFLIHNTKWNCS